MYYFESTLFCYSLLKECLFLKYRFVKNYNTNGAGRSETGGQAPSWTRHSSELLKTLGTGNVPCPL